MMNKQRFFTTNSLKQTPKIALKKWLPVLQCATNELNSLFLNAAKENPYLEAKITSPHSKKNKIGRFGGDFPNSKENSSRENIERLSIRSESLYEYLYGQIERSTIFPTEFSKKIAHEITWNIDDEGFFEGDIEEIAKKFNTDSKEVEKIRLRFSFLEPIGIATLDLQESFLVQLADLELEDELYSLLKEMVVNLEAIGTFCTHGKYTIACEVLKRLKNPPAIDFLVDSKAIIPEVFIERNEDELLVSLNDRCYPELSIRNDIGNVSDERRRDAKRLIDFLGLRKSTLLNITQFIVKRQKGFFYGKELSSLAMREIADEFGYSQSTISRAIAGKYLQCERGIFALKEMFAYTISENISSQKIKMLIGEVIENENKERPLSDEKIMRMINGHLHIDLVRRSITKYRIEMGIGNSNQRKQQEN